MASERFQRRIDSLLDQVEEAQPLDSLAGGVFVGRHREMGELKACLEDALSHLFPFRTLVVVER